jgi:hypothetical protein
MKTRYKQSGRTLAEMTVVIAVIVLLGSIGLPAIRAFLDSFESGTGARPVISAALASARAIAAKEQRYAGIRFQKAYNPDFPLDPLKADQYMVFIINDPNIGAYFFRAVEGLEPIKLPDSIGVMDYKLINQTITSSPTWEPSSNHPVDLIDLTTFSIIFSPSGKMVIHDVRVRNRDGQSHTSAILSYDDVFNTQLQVDAGIGMFYQDDYYPGYASTPNLGLGPEPSRRAFVIYDRREFKSAYDKGRAYSDYLSKLIPNEVIQINPYTGTMVEK